MAMSEDSSLHDFVTQRQIHDLVVQRLVERVFNQPLINNAERGAYVECLVELAMKSVDPRWGLTGTWDPWDLEHSETRARIEIKQSSILQRWNISAPPVKSTGRFDIAPHEGYWWTYSDGKTRWVPTDLRRHADIYVFARHCEDRPAHADHRQARQWEFFVVPEPELPPGQKSISLNPLHGLVETCDYRALAETVTRALPDPALLKVNLTPPPEYRS